MPRAEPVLRPRGVLWAAALWVGYLALVTLGVVLLFAAYTVARGRAPRIDEIPFGVLLGIDFAGKAAAVGGILLALRLRRDHAPLVRPAAVRPAAVAGLLTALAFLPVSLGTGMLQTWLYGLLEVEFRTQDIVMKALQGSAGQFAAVAAFGVLVAPVFEEIVFRGFLHAGLRTRLGPAAAAFVAAAAFSGSHFERDAFPALLLMGLFLSDLRERTGGLTAPIAMHACYNAYSMAGVWLARGAGG